MQSKIDLRGEMRARLRNVSGTRDERSRVLCNALVQRSDYRRASSVAIFDPLPSEPDISLLWELLPRRFCYPRIVNGALQFFFAESVEELEKSPELPFREPPVCKERRVNSPEIDLILVPGLAFSPDGRRLGRGGGYYDHLLATLLARTARVGVCFSFQVLLEVPTEPHDERVHAVVSD